MKNSRHSLAVSAAWIGSSQLSIRFARIITTIVVARVFAPEALGVAAIALAVNELSHVFARNATNSRIIFSEDNEVKAFSDSAYFVNWLVGFCLFFLQCFAGYVLAKIYNDSSIFNIVSVLAVSYLLLPFAQVHSALNLRDEKIGLMSKTEIQQTILDTVFTITMIMTGFGLWSLIVPKVLVVPVWIFAHRRACSWKSPDQISLEHISDHLAFNSRVLGVELLGVVRHNIDYVLVGYFLGMHALGIYYFAYNAGLGLTRGFIVSLNNAFYPYLCAARNLPEEMVKRYRLGLRYMLLLIVPLLGLQAYLAEYYVPILFGEQWTERNAVQYVAIICLTGLPLLVMETGSQFMRANGRPTADLKWYASYTLVFVAAIVIGIQWGLMGVVMAVLLAQFVAAPLHFLFLVNPQKPNNEISVLAKAGGMEG